MFILKWIEDHPQWIAIFFYSILEAFLGKTNKVRSGSLLEMIFYAVRSIFRSGRKVEDLANSKE